MKSPDFSQGLLPAIVQDAETHAVLMLGYMNSEAYQKTLETGLVTFYSRSRQHLWTKGETSGHYLRLVELRVDCDGDALLVRALPEGPTCHRGTYSCFTEAGETPGSFLAHLWRLIGQRAESGTEGSYTIQLMQAGAARTAQKVGEEAIETLIAALAQGPQATEAEAADLLYHLWVLLWQVGASPQGVEAVLRERHARRTRI